MLELVTNAIFEKILSNIIFSCYKNYCAQRDQILEISKCQYLIVKFLEAIQFIEIFRHNKSRILGE